MTDSCCVSGDMSCLVLRCIILYHPALHWVLLEVERIDIVNEHLLPHRLIDTFHVKNAIILCHIIAMKNNFWFGFCYINTVFHITFFELVSSSKQGRWHSKQMCHSLHMGWEIPFNILLLLNIKIPMSIHVSTQLPRSLMIFEVTLLFSDKIFDRIDFCLCFSH